jgi:transcriptional regulator with XRE-family HTH domain
MTKFGEKLKQLRLSKGLKQAELASQCSLTQGSISQFEMGLRFPTSEMIRKLALSLSVDEKDFLYDPDYEKNELLHNIDSLSPTEIKQLKDYAEFLRSRNT